jgi:hypothetical protein
MSEEPKRIQQHEGPWRKLTPHRANDFAGEVNSYLPNNKTGAENLDEQYGQGNWKFDTTRFDAERQAEVEITRAANKIALEGLHNVILSNMISDAYGKPRKPVSDIYVDDEGNNLTGKVQNQALPSPLGDILISPDGDKYHQEKYGDKK